MDSINGLFGLQPSFKTSSNIFYYSIQTKNDHSTAITYTMNKVCPVSIGAVCGYQRSRTVRDKPFVWHLFSITFG